MGLFKVAIKGVAWSTASTIIRSVVSLLQISILTRYLEKSDFGIIAIAILYIGFIQIFMDMGISIGILHKQDITPKQYSSLFWLNVLLGLVLTLLLAILSPLVAMFYKEKELVYILGMLSTTLFFSSLGIQHKTVQQKKLRFKYISTIEIITSVLTLSVAIILAELDYGIYSLVYSTIFHTFLTNLFFLGVGLRKDKNISFHFRINEIRPFLKIGYYSVGTQVLDYFSREIDIILISSTLGNEVLGIYSLCKKLVTSFYSFTIPIIHKVLTPLLSTVQNDITRIRNIYYDVIETIAIVNFPIYIIIAVFSTGIIYFLYGKAYIEGAPSMSILALYFGFLSTGSPVGALQTALGRTDSGFYWTICRIVFCSIAVYIGSFWSINGVVFSLFIMAHLSTPIAWKITIRPLIYGDFWEYYKKVLKPFAVAIILAISFFLLCYSWTSLYSMIVGSILYLIFYTIVAVKIFNNSYIIQKGKIAMENYKILIQREKK